MHQSRTLFTIISGTRKFITQKPEYLRPFLYILWLHWILNWPDIQPIFCQKSGIRLNSLNRIFLPLTSIIKNPLNFCLVNKKSWPDFKLRHTVCPWSSYTYYLQHSCIALFVNEQVYTSLQGYIFCKILW